MIDYSKDTSHLDVHMVPGEVRVALFPDSDEPFIPDDYTEDALFKLDRVDEVGASGASSYYIVLRYDSKEDMAKLLLDDQLAIDATLCGCNLRKQVKREKDIIASIQLMWTETKGEPDKDTINYMLEHYDMDMDEWIEMCKKARTK